jgi:hypothetical protein
MEEKLSILTELIKLSRVDKKYRNEEYLFLTMIANTLSVSKQQLDDLFNKYVKYTPPKLEMQRILQFQRLILLANVDMEIDNTETKLIYKAGIKLGLRPESIEKVLAEMKKYERGMIPEEKLIYIFKTHHN